jgi:hypothetical protein
MKLIGVKGRGKTTLAKTYGSVPLHEKSFRRSLASFCEGPYYKKHALAAEAIRRPGRVNEQEEL